MTTWNRYRDMLVRVLAAHAGRAPMWLHGEIDEIEALTAEALRKYPERKVVRGRNRGPMAETRGTAYEEP